MVIRVLFAIIVSVLVNESLFALQVPTAFPPFRIAANLYYVGTDDVASYLIVTPKGNILINSNLQSTVPLLKASIEKLGFTLQDTKILLINHAHYDHAGGSALIKKLSKAEYMVMNKDVPVIESGGLLDFAYGQNPRHYFAKTRVDKVLHDGEQVTLGGTVLTAHLTPGHTKGCTTWTMQVRENNKIFQVVIAGSLTVNRSYQLINNANYPTITQDYEHSFTVLKSLPCDIFLADHARFFHLKQKFDLMIHNRSLGSFIDPDGYKEYIASKELAFHRALARQQGDPAADRSTPDDDE